MTRYKHTQVGYLMIIVLVAVTFLYVWLFRTIPKDESPLILFVVMIFVLLIIGSFSTLTVSIDENYLRLKFTFGVFRKKINIKEISSVRATRNRWYHGWGIKLFFWPKMWIYSVSGLDAVELIMKNGTIYRIGTDSPQELERAIQQSIVR